MEEYDEEYFDNNVEEEPIMTKEEERIFRIILLFRFYRFIY